MNMIMHTCDCGKTYFSKEKFEQHKIRCLELKNNMLKKLNKINVPTYSEIIFLGEEDFSYWLLYLANNLNDILLKQMIEHEEQTHSLAKTQIGRKITPSHEKIYTLFVPETSANTKDIFQQMFKVTGIDLVKSAILAKATTDWGIYGKK